MVDAGTLRTAVGILGNIISFCLFVSPTPAFIGIYKAKAVQSYKPHPYLATIFNCAMWLIYGMPFVHPDSTLVLTINGIGLVIEAIFITIFIIYADAPKRKKVFIFLIVEFILWAVMFLVTMLAFHDTKSRSMLVGIACVVLNILMYASPLTVMKQVIKTKSVKFMPFTLSLANFVNGIVWTTYAFLKFDLYVLIPNALGTLSGVIQLVLYATYYRTTKWNDDGKLSPSVELSSSNV